MHSKVERVARRVKNSAATGPKLTKFLVKRKGVVGGVNQCIHVAILPSVVERQRTEWTCDMPIFADSRQKSVAIASPLGDREKKISLLMPTHICTYPEN